MSEVIAQSVGPIDEPTPGSGLDWSRPHLQRTEIGPIFHFLAHHAYDTVHLDVKNHTLHLPIVNSLGHVASIARNIALQAVDNPLVHELSRVPYSPNSPHAALHDFLEAHTGRTANDLFAPHRSLTTIPLRSLLNEGIASGLTVPLQLYYMRLLRRHVNTPEFLDLYEGKNEFPVDAVACADEIESPEFMKDLHTMAYTSNGQLGGLSNSAILIHGGLLEAFWEEGCLQAYMAEEVVQECIEYDKQTGKMHFSESARKHLSSKIKQENQNRSPQGQTGGCPVRHASFKRVGEHASRFLAENSATGQLEHEGTSAITRGAQLLAFALRHAAPDRN